MGPVALGGDGDLSLSLGHNVRAQQDGGHPHTSGRVLTGNRIGWHLDLVLPASGTVRNQCLWFKRASLWSFVMAA